MAPAVADLALLSDCQTAALVDREGTLRWWCVQRFDARPCFASLLDPGAGHLALGPIGAAEVTRRYREDSLVLETTFRTAAGAVRLTDALAFDPGSRGHQVGREVPHALVRVLEGLEGEVDVALEVAPRLDWGLVHPELVPTPGGVRTLGGPDTVHVDASVPLELARDAARGRATLRPGERLSVVVRVQQGWERPEGPVLPDAWALLEDTEEGWRSWVAEHEAYEGAYGDLVRRSALVLKGLTYAPTGALVAAATTSLPEVPGDAANWDYRYAWLRDGSLTVRALTVAACADECLAYLGFMARAGASCGTDRLPQIVFGVAGERDLSERELHHLAGYGGARPVRVGNAAWTQFQLDVPGEVLDAAWQLRDEVDGMFDDGPARFLVELADATVECWREDDAGLWEGREGQRPYTPSKVLAWTALDRAIRLADRLGAQEHVERWARERDELRQVVLEQAWHEGVGAYTGSLGSDHLDAGVLLMPLMDFLPADDPRMRATIETVARELVRDGLVMRWTGAEDEGGFAICSFWLAECFARLGEVDRARELFERAAGHANDLGLLAECLDGDGQGLHGNFPQAFSHVGLVNAAAAIDRAQAAGGV